MSEEANNTNNSINISRNQFSLLKVYMYSEAPQVTEGLSTTYQSCNEKVPVVRFPHNHTVIYIPCNVLSSVSKRKQRERI